MSFVGAAEMSKPFFGGIGIDIHMLRRNNHEGKEAIC